MKKVTLTLLAVLTLSFAVFAQPNNSAQTQAASNTTETKKRAVFRATKDQITQAQKMLKVAETGKMDDAFREALKKYQSENGLKDTGTLNRATLEKMSIALTENQKQIPVSESSYAATGENKSTETKKRGPVFRANKDQIMKAQKMLKEKGMYSGEETGKLDDATREGLKKFQAANGAKVTGTLNRETLEKMGIALTDRQKEM
jgi:peptidoglycan hydrolase-like protein with peptidoglycan-binding domain